MGEEIAWILFAIIVIRYKHWFYIYNSLRNELGNTIADGNRIAMRENQTNPLYVKGYLRKISKKNAHWKMARLKGLFITQIIAIIEMVTLLIVMTAILYENYIGNAGMLGWIAIKREKIYIMSFILICLNGYMSVFFQMYYQHIIEKTRKKNYAKFFDTSIVCTGNSKSARYQSLRYENLLENKRRMYEVQSSFDNFFSGITYHLFETIGDIERNVIIAVDENISENNTQILVQMYVKSLDKDNVTMLNKYIHKEIRKAVKHNNLPLGKPYVTYIIYAEESSELFQKIFCRELNDSPVCCFPVGIVLNENKMYIPQIESSQYPLELEKMKKRVYKILTEIPKKEE